MPGATFVEPDRAGPDEAVVVVDVLRAFTTVPWLLCRGVDRLLAVSSRRHARALRATHLPGALLAGEDGGRRVEDFDLGNAPSELVGRDLTGSEVILRTSAGTRGLVDCAGSPLLLAASFVVAGATVRTLRDAGVSRVSYVITGASRGRDGDEDLACAELIAARLDGHDPDTGPLLDRVRRSDAGRSFTPSGPDWALPEDLVLACQVDRFQRSLHAAAVADLDAIEITPGGAGRRSGS